MKFDLIDEVSLSLCIHCIISIFESDYLILPFVYY